MKPNKHKPSNVGAILQIQKKHAQLNVGNSQELSGIRLPLDFLSKKQ